MKNITKKQLPFRGVGTALVTPFDPLGRVDLPTFSRLCLRQLEGGVSALIVAGTTGEAVTLRKSERAALLASACEACEGRLPIVAGTGSADTREAVANARYAAAHGADALLIVTPYYNKGTREGLIKHYLTVAEAVDCPIILYNVPSRTGVNIPMEALRKLSEHENIVAIKEASGSIDRAADIITELGERLFVYSGNDGEILPTLSLGGIGVISVVSNLFPEKTSRLCTLYEEGRVREAAALAARLLPLIRLLFADTNPAPVKYAMRELGLLSGGVRLPLTMPDEALSKRIRDALGPLLD